MLVVGVAGGELAKREITAQVCTVGVQGRALPSRQEAAWLMYECQSDLVGLCEKALGGQPGVLLDIWGGVVGWCSGCDMYRSWRICVTDVLYL